MPNLQDLEYFIDFYNHGISNKKIKLKVLAQDTENDTAALDYTKLQRQVTMLELNLISLKRQYFNLKIKEHVLEEDKLSLKKFKLIQECNTLGKALIDNYERQSFKLYENICAQINALDGKILHHYQEIKNLETELTKLNKEQSSLEHKLVQHERLKQFITPKTIPLLLTSQQSTPLSSVPNICEDNRNSSPALLTILGVKAAEGVSQVDALMAIISNINGDKQFVEVKKNKLN